MKILSHRGYWKTVKEKNTPAAFQRSFSMEFGTETDIRDFNQKLVISHDIATGMEMDLDSLLKLADSSKLPLTLALNIKADGLAPVLHQTLKNYPGLDCFVFDMSIPDMRGYFNYGIPVFTRMSEIEQTPAWINRAEGVWLDSFESEWFDASVIQNLLQQDKRVCIVSPELHQRNYLPLWESIKHLSNEPHLMLCTDNPEQASQYFQGQ